MGIASDVDWSTNTSVVNPVKDQGQCGSCWAFSAVGTVESAYALAAGKLGSYAEQQLVDCSTNGGSECCNGGFNQYGIQYIGTTGIASESSYPYKAVDGTCRASSVSKALAAGAVAGYKSVGKNNAALESSPSLAASSARLTMPSSQWATTALRTLSRSVTHGVHPGARPATCASTTP